MNRYQFKRYFEMKRKINLLVDLSFMCSQLFSIKNNVVFFVKDFMMRVTLLVFTVLQVDDIFSIGYYLNLWSSNVIDPYALQCKLLIA